ncbi:MAG TPA: fumarylacetoacetate hydrolase family protein [Candidatus Binataceae bacterium]|nr:fumarylacetoacetate hydrolase family protein [Candidatus Binataceae bacterium]
MKLASFKRGGRPGFGAVVDGGVIDLTGRIAGASTLKELLQVQELEQAREFCKNARPDFTLDECSLLPVIPNPNKIICIGVNYTTHGEEAGVKPTSHPVIFLRLPEVLIGQGRQLIRPKVSEEFDYEGELAVIMGKPGSHIREENAMSYVAGYSCFNDASVRDWQFHTRQFGMGKNFRNSGPFGPWMVTADEMGDYHRQTLRTLLNGKEVQRTTLDQMVFDVPKLIAYVSQALPWSPGDVISTGTPAGVARFSKPPRYMRAGDTVEVEISGIGKLSNPVIDEI